MSQTSDKNVANKRQKCRKQATKMSQTSDKNVAKVTKSDIDILNALIYVYEARLPNYNELMDSEVKSLKNILAEREQMLKAINTVEKEKGEWIEECVQKDKRIQELEKQLQKYYNGELYTAKQLKNLENNQRKYFINKQEVIDKLERHKFAYEEFSKEYNNKHYEDDEVRARDFYMIVAEDRIVQVLQELLEGERK